MSVEDLGIYEARRVALYRLFDEEARLLYVGKSVHPRQRWREHAADKPWWGEVRSKTTEWFDSEKEATRAEIAAIQTERPRYNILGTPRHREVSGAQRATLDSERFPQLNDIMTGLAAVENPVERFKAAAETIELARLTLMPEASKIRQDAVNELRDQHMSLAEISKLTGQTRSRIQQINEGRTGGKSKPTTSDNPES